MNRFIGLAVLLPFVTALSVSAQRRLDGCLTPEEMRAQGQDALNVGHGMSSEDVDKALKGAEYAFTRESLVSALHDPRPDVRSLAARKLGDVGQPDVIPALMEAWSAEEDTCARGELEVSLDRIGQALTSRVRDARGGQMRPSPFQSCTPSAPRIISLTIERPEPAPTWTQGPIIRVSMRNLTGRPLAIFKQPSPADMFSVVVLDPFGGHAKIAKDRDKFYRTFSELPSPTFFGRSGPTKPVLEAHEETSWEWPVWQDLDVSEPGIYRISLGGKLDYLNTTVCSNALEVTVGK